MEWTYKLPEKVQNGGSEAGIAKRRQILVSRHSRRELLLCGSKEGREGIRQRKQHSDHTLHGGHEEKASREEDCEFCIDIRQRQAMMGSL